MQTNIRQDYCSYDQQLKKSMGPGLYHINTPCNDPNVCSQDITPDPYYRYQKYGYATCHLGTNVTDELYYVNISPDLNAGSIGMPKMLGVKASWNY